MENKVYTIIVTHNSLHNNWIQKCLDSLEKSNYPNQILVIDNNSSDKTVSYIQKNYKNVFLIENDQNFGFGKANNIGISYAMKKGADYIFLLNQDAYVENNTIENLVEISIKNPNYGILSPIHLNGDGSKIDRNFSYYLTFDRNNNFYSDYVLNYNKKNIYDIPFVNAAAWLIPKKTLEIVGGFDPIFHHYGEDENYCQRVKFHGLKIGVITNSYIKHDRENRASNKMKKFSNEYYNDINNKFKIKYADINKTCTKEEIKLEKRALSKSIVLSFLTLNFQNVIGNYKLLKLLNQSFKNIRLSRKINIVEGPHYL